MASLTYSHWEVRTRRGEKLGVKRGRNGWQYEFFELGAKRIAERSGIAVPVKVVDKVEYF